MWKEYAAEEWIARTDKKLFLKKPRFFLHRLHQLMSIFDEDKNSLRKRRHPFMMPVVKSTPFKSSLSIDVSSVVLVVHALYTLGSTVRVPVVVYLKYA